MYSTIDGGGRPWWLRKLAGNATGAPGDPKTPNALGFYWCDDVVVRDVRVTNSPSFGVFVQESQRVLVERCVARDPRDDGAAAARAHERLLEVGQ